MENAWVSPTQKGQTVGSAYMTLTSKQDATLIKVESNVAKAVEIHSMSMERGVMKMRMLDNLVLSAGTPYQLEPGGLHLMLFDLTTPLKVGGEVEFELTFKNQKSETFKQRIRAKIRTEECANDAHAHHGHH
ncbi:MAG: copper chaperone PCu(A)C [Betaproteobacteria bacterium]|nr:copper chaperone PCu(A)C [Betaproteobacteria bacterium]